MGTADAVLKVEGSYVLLPNEKVGQNGIMTQRYYVGKRYLINCLVGVVLALEWMMP